MTVYNMLLAHPSTWLVTGASNSGKTTFTIDILRNKNILFQNGEKIKNVIYFFNEWQDKFNGLQEAGVVTEFVNEFPSIELVKEKTLFYKNQGGSIIVIDDMMQNLNQDISTIFTTLSHHLKIIVFLLLQNLFPKNPVAREISLNSNYVVIFKNPRDSSQIVHFAKQFAPSAVKKLVETYRKATIEPHSYVLFDNLQSTPEAVRIRSKILPSDDFMLAYVPRK